MLPGRRYTPANILWILRKRKLLLIGPFIVFAATGIWVSLSLPDQYRASTLILVVPQRVPENYVRPAIAESIEQRLLSISPQILSETRLERIITELDLYPKQRQEKGGIQDVIKSMRNDINVEIIKGDLFRVTYSGSSPYKVMQVTQRLASLFVEENLKDREQLAVGTNQFLDSQLEIARTRLEEQERKNQEYRQTHAGELPSQIGANLQVLQTAGVQLLALQDSLSRDRDRKLELEDTLAQLERSDPPMPKAAATGRGAAGSSGGTAPEELPSTGVTAQTISNATQLQAARQRLETMQQRLTNDHPDVIAAKRLIKELERSVAQDVLKGTGTAMPDDPVLAAKLTRMAQARTQLASVEKEIARKTAEETRLKQLVATYQARVETEPARESELIALTRDYDTLKETYRSLLAKKEESGIAANLERQQVSQQFKTIDAARLPAEPYAPSRRLIALVAGGIGFALGFGLTVILELRDQSFRSGAEIVQRLSLPVIAMVPAVITRHEQRRQTRQFVLSLAVVLMAGLVGGGYYAFRNWW